MTNLPASVHARLLTRARASGEDFNLLLTRFGLERLLYRLSVSRHADNFLLKGALLFALWYDQPHRATRDADLLGYGADDAATLISVFRDICAIDESDGIAFDVDSVSASTIRDDNEYGGIRVTLLGRIGNARIPIQVDIGFGDAVTPAPEQITYPVLIKDFPAPELRACPIYTVVAEKYQAMVMLGMANSRMKDFYDLYVIARTAALDGSLLAQAIAATFERRRTDLPEGAAIPLTDSFFKDVRKNDQWTAFLKRNRLEPIPLSSVIATLAEFLVPPTGAIVEDSTFSRIWRAAGPWEIDSEAK